jgi:hypothetical protein
MDECRARRQSTSSAPDNLDLYRDVSGHSSVSGRQRQALQNYDHAVITAQRLRLRAIRIAGKRYRANERKLLSCAAPYPRHDPERRSGLVALGGVFPARPEAAQGSTAKKNRARTHHGRQPAGALARDSGACPGTWPRHNFPGGHANERKPQHRQKAYTVSGIRQSSDSARKRQGYLVFRDSVMPDCKPWCRFLGLLIARASAYNAARRSGRPAVELPPLDTWNN